MSLRERDHPPCEGLHPGSFTHCNRLIEQPTIENNGLMTTEQLLLGAITDFLLGGEDWVGAGQWAVANWRHQVG